MSETFVVEPASLERDSEELAFLFREQSPADRRRGIDDLLEQAADGRARVECLIAARQPGGLLSGVALAMRHGRTTCFVWPPVVDESHPDRETIADRLVESVRRHLESSDLAMGQVMSGEHDRRAHGRLSRGGFVYLADLEFLQRTLRDELPAGPERLQRETYDASTNHGRFERLIEATYEGTLDCANLRTRRPADEVLEGHRECGTFAPERWTIFTRDGEDVGLLLLTDHPEQSSWEVVYVGVHHGHRGHGYGAEMLSCGIRAAREAGRDSMILAVDAANTPALRVYEELGFVPIARRAVHVWYADAR